MSWQEFSRIAASIPGSDDGEDVLGSFVSGVSQSDSGGDSDGMEALADGGPPVISPIASMMAANDNTVDHTTPPIPVGPGESTLSYYASMADHSTAGGDGGPGDGSPDELTYLSQIADNTDALVQHARGTGAGGTQSGGGGNSGGGGFFGGGQNQGGGGGGSDRAPWYTPPQEWGAVQQLDETVSGTIQVVNMWSRALQDGVDGLRSWNAQANENTERGIAGANQSIDKSREYFLMNGQIGAAVIQADMRQFGREIERSRVLSDSIAKEVRSADRLRESLEPSLRRGMEMDSSLNRIGMTIHKGLADMYEYTLGPAMEQLNDMLKVVADAIDGGGDNNLAEVQAFEVPVMAAAAMSLIGGSEVSKRDRRKGQGMLKRTFRKQGNGP